jgi:hypothetical protein
MNCTQWEKLADFVKWLGREGNCVVDETEKGWYTGGVYKTTYPYFVGFEILTAVFMWRFISCGTTPWSPLQSNRRFGDMSPPSLAFETSVGFQCTIHHCVLVNKLLFLFCCKTIEQMSGLSSMLFTDRRIVCTF